MSRDSIGGFGWALDTLEQGEKVYRRFWPNWRYIKIQRADENSKMTCSFIYTNPEQGLLIPWTPSQSDIFAQDWEVVVKCRNCGK